MRASPRKKRTVGDGDSRFILMTWRTYWTLGRDSCFPGSRARSKHACAVSTENIDGSSSALFPIVTRAAKSLTGMELSRTLKTVSARKKSCGKTSASFAELPMQYLRPCYPESGRHSALCESGRARLHRPHHRRCDHFGLSRPHLSSL